MNKSTQSSPLISIAFYALIGFAIYSASSLLPLFALLVSPKVFDSLNSDKKENIEDEQLNS